MGSISDNGVPLQLEARGDILVAGRREQGVEFYNQGRTIEQLLDPAFPNSHHRAGCRSLPQPLNEPPCNA